MVRVQAKLPRVCLQLVSQYQRLGRHPWPRCSRSLLPQRTAVGWLHLQDRRLWRLCPRWESLRRGRRLWESWVWVRGGFFLMDRAHLLMLSCWDTGGFPMRQTRLLTLADKHDNRWWFVSTHATNQMRKTMKGGNGRPDGLNNIMLSLHIYIMRSRSPAMSKAIEDHKDNMQHSKSTC